jgi:hypothetical protein
MDKITGHIEHLFDQSRNLTISPLAGHSHRAPSRNARGCVFGLVLHNSLVCSHFCTLKNMSTASTLIWVSARPLLKLSVEVLRVLFCPQPFEISPVLILFIEPSLHLSGTF